MLLYLVVARYPNGYREERIFAVNRAARAYSAAHPAEAFTEIIELPVVGTLARPDAAYTIRWNDGTPDTENVEGVYGSDGLARVAVGRHGNVHQLHIDISPDAADAILALPDRIGHNVVNFHQASSGMRQNRAQRIRTTMERLA